MTGQLGQAGLPAAPGKDRQDHGKAYPMKLGPQLLLIAGILAIAVPVSARFVPGTHPWLEKVGLLGPLAAVGLVPAPPEGAGAPGQGGRSGSGTPVIAEPVATATLQDLVSVIGSARGAQSVDLSFGITGRIADIRVAPGDRVEAGTLIAELDVGAAQLSVDRAHLVLENAQRAVDRLNQLAQTGTATALQRQDAELALRTAELELKEAQRVLEDHRLTAPTAGFVGLIEPQVGDLVSSSTPITRIEDRSNLILDFRVPERLAALVKVGDPVEAGAISQPGPPVGGRIIAVDNRVDETSRTLRVQASIGNPDDVLRAGMAFQVDLTFNGADYPAIDPLAIQWGSDGAYVWVVRDGKAAQQPISIIQRNVDAVLVEADFTPDDLIVTEGVNLMRPGAAVTVTPPRS
jgi:RND family efflux transporter MFP subunit